MTPTPEDVARAREIVHAAQREAVAEIAHETLALILRYRIVAAFTTVRAEARREERTRGERIAAMAEFLEVCKVGACDHEGPTECIAAAIHGQEDAP